MSGLRAVTSNLGSISLNAIIAMGLVLAPIAPAIASAPPEAPPPAAAPPAPAPPGTLSPDLVPPGDPPTAEPEPEPVAVDAPSPTSEPTAAPVATVPAARPGAFTPAVAVGNPVGDPADALLPPAQPPKPGLPMLIAGLVLFGTGTPAWILGGLMLGEATPFGSTASSVLLLAYGGLALPTSFVLIPWGAVRTKRYNAWQKKYSYTLEPQLGRTAQGTQTVGLRIRF